MIAENPPPTKATDAGPKSTFLSKSTIKSGRWYRLRPVPDEPTVLGAVLKTLVGAAVGGLAYAYGATKLAILIWCVAAVIGVVSLSSQTARSGVSRVFAKLGQWVGWILGTALLAPVYLFGFTIARLVGRLAGKDPLHLREKGQQTYWLPADQDRRTVRHIRSLYATEVPARGGRIGVIAVASMLGLLLIGEVIARFWGFGNPIVYKTDPTVGYYTAPSQESKRYGGNIKLNSFGMRAPEMERAKKPGTLRIFMIGDSTLWGGSYVDQSDIYARLIDDSLDNKAGSNDVEIWNMGVNAWGPHEELGYVKKFGAFDADVAVVCLPTGDIYRNMKTIANVPYFTDEAPPNFGLEEIAHHLLWGLRVRMKGPPSKELVEERGRQGLAAYAELAKQLQDDGCEVIFLVLPSREAGMAATAPADEEKDVARLREVLKPLGITVDFPVGLFKDKGTPAEMYFDVCHLYKKGNHAYADYLKSRLEELSAKLKAHRTDGSGRESAAATSASGPASEGGKQ